MDKKDLKKMNLTPIEDLIEEDFGAVGTPERDQFEMECDVFVIGEQLKDERLKAGLTQEQLAEKIGTKKSFISKAEHVFIHVVKKIHSDFLCFCHIISFLLLSS